MTARHSSNVALILDAALAVRPDDEALVGRSGRLSYRELDDAADRAAAVLADRGLRCGDRIAASLPNDVDIIVAFHAAMRLGAIWVGVNRNLAPPEKAFLLQDSATNIVLVDPEGVAAIDAVRSGLDDLRHIIRVDAGALAGGDGDWDGTDRITAQHIDPFAPAGYAYTSGTTGHPKGVVHSQHNLVLPGAAIVASRGYDARLRKGDCLPFTILNMLVLSTLLTAQAEATCVAMDRLDAAGIAEWIRTESITTWNGVPAILSSLARDDTIPASDLASLDECWTGGDHCPAPIRLAFEQKFGLQLTSSYGLTEAPAVVTMDPRSDQCGNSGDASGVPLPHLDVIISDETGTPLPVGEAGEVCITAAASGDWAGTYRFMLGYLRHDDATTTALTGGRLHTGDVGALGPDGRLTLHARRSAVIIRGGANVYPAEVERVLIDSEGVSACAVFAVDDDRLGQRVAAAIVPAAGVDIDVNELRATCLRQLARYKVPDRIVIVDSMPRNAMGKIERTRLAAWVESHNAER